MGVELHIRSSTFAVLIARAMQRTLLTACLPPSDGLYLDHADPLPNLAQWSGGAGTATLRLPLNVYVVQRDDLLAHPNQVPAGSTTPVGQAVLIIGVSIDSGALSLITRDVDGAPDDVRRTVLDALGSPPRIDVSSIISRLGVDTTAGGSVELVGELLVARFGAFVTPPAPVSHGFDWALFLDGDSIERLMLARIPTSIPPLQSVTRLASWQPGTHAFVNASIEGPVKVPDPATLRVTVSLGCTLSMPRPAPEMVIDIGYELSLDTGLLAFEPIVAAAVAVAKAAVLDQAINPEAFGGVRTGGASFAITLPLPQIQVANEAWRYDGMAFGPAGVVIGGTVGLPVDLSNMALHTDFSRFSGSTFASLWCSHDDPQTDVPLAQFFSTVAEVTYEGGGNLCDVEVVPGGSGLEDHLTLPKELPLSGGLRPGDGKIFIGFGVAAANQVQTPIQLIVRTSRGVRCHDLGQPEHFTVLPDGTIDGAEVMWFDDCNRLPPNFGNMTPEEYERWTGVIWYTYWGLVPGRDYDPERPPILPDTLDDIPAQWSDVTVALPVTSMDAGTQVTVPEGFTVTTLDTGTDITLDTTIGTTLGIDASTGVEIGEVNIGAETEAVAKPEKPEG